MHSHCENCEQSKKELNDVKIKLSEFQNLAKKIIQTDLLLQKYSELEKEMSSLKNELINGKKDYDLLDERFQIISKENESSKKLNRNLMLKKEETDMSLKEMKESLEEANKKEKYLLEQVKTLNDRNNELQNELIDHSKKIELLNMSLKQTNQNYINTKQELENLRLPDTKEKPQNYPCVKTDSKTNIFEITGNNTTPAEVLAKKDVSFFLSDDEGSEETKESSPTVVKTKLTNDKTNIDKIETNTLNYETGQTEIQQEISSSQLVELEFSESCSSSENESNASSCSTSTSSTTHSSVSSDKISISKFDDSVFDKSIKADDSVDKIHFDFSDDEDEKYKKNEIEIEPRSTEKSECLKLEEIENNKQKQENLEKNRKEAEQEIKLNELLHELTLNRADNFLSSLISQVITEISMCDFIMEKLINEEVKKELKELINIVIKDEHEEKKQLEKKLREEMKSKLELEFIGRYIDEVVAGLIKECCERTIHQEKSEQNMKILEGILDELMPKMIEKELFNVIFEEMSCAKEVITNKALLVSELIDSTHNKTSQMSCKSRLQFQEPKFKRLKIEYDFDSRLKTSNTSVHGSDSLVEKLENTSTTSDIKTKESTSYREIRNHIKEYLSEYFRAYNSKTGFSFAELDLLIEKMSKANTIDVDKSKFFSDLLIIHFINNKFIPLDETKHNKQFQYEEGLFKELRNLVDKKNSLSNQQEISAIEKILKQKQSKQDNIINIKITSEEEKYVYLIKKLKEHQHYETLVEEILLQLKTMILSSDFNKFYIYRIARMVVFMCKANKISQFLNWFIFDLIAFNNPFISANFHNLVTYMARIWPEFLYYTELETIQNPVLCVIMYIYKSNVVINAKQNVDQANYYIYTMKKLCNWNFRFETSFEIWEYFQNVLSVDSFSLNYHINDQNDEIFILNEKEFKFVPLMFEYTQAFKLICLNEGWKWTQAVFFNEILKKKFEEINETCVEDEELEQKTISHKFVAFFLYVKASILSQMCPKRDSAEAIDTINLCECILKKLLLQETSLNNKETFTIECSILESFLLLCPFNPEKCFIQIQMWLLKQQKKVTQIDSSKISVLPFSLEEKIKRTYELIKQRLPNHIVIT